jgi:hypothetical protein
MRWNSRNASAADGSDWADDAVVVGNDVDTTGHPLVDVVRRRSIAPEQRQACEAAPLDHTGSSEMIIRNDRSPNLRGFA